MTRILKSTKRDTETGEEITKTCTKVYNANQNIDRPDYLKFRHAKKQSLHTIAPNTFWQTRCGNIALIKKVETAPKNLVNLLAVSGYIIDSKGMRSKQYWTRDGHYSITVNNPAFISVVGQHHFDLVVPISLIAYSALLNLLNLKEGISEKRPGSPMENIYV